MAKHGTEAAGQFDAMFSTADPQEALRARRDEVLARAYNLATDTQTEGLAPLTRSGMLVEVAHDQRNGTTEYAMPQGRWASVSAGQRLARIDRFVVPSHGTPQLEVTYSKTVTFGNGTARPQVYPDPHNSTRLSITEYGGQMTVDGMSVVNGTGTPFGVDGGHDLDPGNPHQVNDISRANTAVNDTAAAINEMVTQAQQMLAQPASA